MSDQNTCLNCKFFSQPFPKGLQNYFGTGRCLRYPPLKGVDDSPLLSELLSEQHGESVFVFNLSEDTGVSIMVSPDGWCGEFVDDGQE